ncbi:MAG: ferrous iron transport protein A [Thermoflexales bacterium]
MKRVVQQDCLNNHFRLDHAPVGKAGRVVHVASDSADLLIKARVMGLREGRYVQVLARNGRITLIQVGGLRMALSCDLAERVELQ